MTNYTLRLATQTERMYTYTQSTQIGSMTGNVGHLRADMDSGGDGFFSSWTDFRGDLKTEAFKKEFDDLINQFRFGDPPEDFLKSRTVLSKYCFSFCEAGDQELRNFFFRADTDDFAYLFRLNPNKGEYNVYCYAYVRKWLDQHLQKAERGIRFIDMDYNDLFRLRDGAKVRLIRPDGGASEVCRYIDETHFELDFGLQAVFHICEFAEWCERDGVKIEPVNEADIIRPVQPRVAGEAR